MSTSANALGNLKSAQGARAVSDSDPTVPLNCHQACEQLAATFGTALHYPEGDNITFWDARQQDVRPACRVEPSSAANVSSIMRTLVQNSCRFAVKCGGHSRHEDDSNSVGGVTVDLGRMNHVTVNENRTAAAIGGGADSQQVYAALGPYNLGFVGGRVGSVGIGGFTLGGGTSALSPRWGWALDNVYEYEVVLANSSIVTVSQHSHPSLYWALRGGANNFGIVTTFTVRVFPQGPLFSGQWTFSANNTDAVLEEAQRLFTEIDDPDMEFEYFDSYSQASNSFSTVARAKYAQAILHPSVYDGVNQIASVATTTSIDSLANLSASAPFNGVDRHLFTTITYYPSLEVSKRAVQIFREEIQSVRNVTGLVPFLIVYPIPKAAMVAMKERGGNALGIDEDSPLIISLLSLIWSDAADDSTMNDFSDRVISRIQAAAVANDADHPYVYVNYAKFDQDPFAGYGEENRQQLIEIQNEVDPEGIFTSKGLWRGFFKLQ
ncbi:uncharacterized protein N0V89_003560 [Didymosphaeria variabile]|uniref:FAD-binding PCMH-type domain-containing protein n=1 Tax=Didymosphaeria variabile TaxID=1932322 RepID=A0A9W8XMW0_9PLEO|nr:uncharacterized protein N0V89_003560 [Didymosphaeria variabile]KAJ4355543.1 hypothetical protein N0V89_003560 [Didymosphaeria variabile]